jgi:hypothetical protein
MTLARVRGRISPVKFATHFAALAAALWFVTPAFAVAAPVVIDFDKDAIGNPIVGGTAVSALYSSLGVTFEHVGPGDCGGGTEVFAGSNCLTAGPISAPNVVTVCPGATCSEISSNHQGFVRANLAQAADEVCIDLLPTSDTQSVRVNTYRADGSPLGVAFVGGAGLHTQCMAGFGIGIRAIEFSGDGDSFAWFDNLKITFMPAPTLPATLGRLKAHYR